MKKRLPILTVVATFMLTGCSGNECYENHSALPLASFYSASTLQQVSVQGLEIYGIGAPGDSILYTPQNLSQAYLPFRLWQDSTSYVFSYVGLVSADGEDMQDVTVPSDTVTFRYKAKEWFVSPACGAMYFYDMEDVSHTSHLIDSISCNEMITNENVTNIKIFFRDVLANE